MWSSLNEYSLDYISRQYFLTSKTKCMSVPLGCVIVYRSALTYVHVRLEAIMKCGGTERRGSEKILVYF